MSHHRLSKFLGANLQTKRWLMERRLECVESNDIDQLSELLSDKQKPNPKELNKALEIAVLKKSDDYLPIITLLLERGANANGKNGSETPFLFTSAEAGCVGVLQCLLEAGGDPQQSRQNGTTALHIASINGHAECVEILLENGADIDVMDLQGRTPITLASQHNNADVIRVILTEGCDVDQQDNREQSAIYWAVRQNNTEIMEMLIEVEAELDLQDETGTTPLMESAFTGDFEILKMLVDNKCQLDIQNYELSTALISAIKQMHLECAYYLIESGADVQLTDNIGGSALYYGAYAEKLVEKLLHLGADPNAQTTQSLTPMCTAISSTSVFSIKLLIQHGCLLHKKIGVVSPTWPLTLAFKHENDKMIKLFFAAYRALFIDLVWVQQEAIKMLQYISQSADPETFQKVAQEELDLCNEIKVQNLSTICRRTVRQELGCIALYKKVKTLPIPPCLKRFLMLSELDEIVDSF